MSPGTPLYWHGLTLIRTWISNYIHYKICSEIIYPFQASTVVPLKAGNGFVIPPDTLLGDNTVGTGHWDELSMLEFKFNHIRTRVLILGQIMHHRCSYVWILEFYIFVNMLLLLTCFSDINENADRSVNENQYLDFMVWVESVNTTSMWIESTKVLCRK